MPIVPSRPCARAADGRRSTRKASFMRSGMYQKGSVAFTATSDSGAHVPHGPATVDETPHLAVRVLVAKGWGEPRGADGVEALEHPEAPQGGRNPDGGEARVAR